MSAPKLSQVSISTGADKARFSSSPDAARSRRKRYASPRSGATLRPAHTLTPQEAAQIRRETAEANTPLWALIVAQLDPMAFEYRLADLEALLAPLKVEQIRRYARKEFPGYFKENGQYCLDFNQAAVVIYRACSDAYFLPDKIVLRRSLVVSGRIAESFPDAHPAVENALSAIQKHRQAKSQTRVTTKRP